MYYLDDDLDFRPAFFAAFAALASFLEAEVVEDKGVLRPELSWDRSVLTFRSVVKSAAAFVFLVVCSCMVDVSVSSPYPEILS